MPLPTHASQQPLQNHKLEESASRIPTDRHHHRSVDRIWPPALDIKLAQWNLEDMHKTDESSNCHQLGEHHGVGSQSISHIIPIPPPNNLDTNQQVYLSGNDERIKCMSNRKEGSDSPRLCEHDRPHQAPSTTPLTPYPPSTGSKGTTIDVQYKKGHKPSKKCHSSTVDTPDTTEATTAVTRTDTTHSLNGDDGAPSPTGSKGGFSIFNVTSPQTHVLHDILARHSNGHIMFPKPKYCTSQCSDTSRSLSSDDDDGGASAQGGGVIPKTETLIGGVVKDKETVKAEMEHDEDGDDDSSDGDEYEQDDRFLLLAQSPNPSEFEIGEFFMSEAQKNTSRHQADSPVFFNGFPLLRMTPLD
ncbi:hypothetical protein BX616_008300 [Lobosporangium transversale]|nr:hypothetical protein BX616_008300 [Lobosporangium transversale]